MAHRLTVWRPGDPVAELVAARGRGALLFIPTESSYGIGVDPASRRAVEAVYAFKGREGGKPLPVVLEGAGQVRGLGLDPASPELAAPLSRAAGCWPGPLTVILPLPAGAADLPAAAGSGGIAVRVPAHAGLRRLLAAVGPLTATSANASGEPPITDPGELERWLAERSRQQFEQRGGDTEAVLIDGGELPGGPPSTLVSFDADGALRVLRRGRLSPREVEACLGPP